MLDLGMLGAEIGEEVAYRAVIVAGGVTTEGRTEGVGRAIAVDNAANDAVEQPLSKTSLAELVRGVG